MPAQPWVATANEKSADAITATQPFFLLILIKIPDTFQTLLMVL